jgi:hypothetical protein
METTVKTDDVLFSKSKDEINLKKREKINVRAKAKKVKHIKSEGFESVKYDVDEMVFGDVVRVELNSKQERTRVKYSVSQDVNKRLLITLNILEEIIPHIKDLGLGCSKGEYERNIVNPLKRFVSTGRVRSKKSKAKGINDDISETVRLSSLQLPRKAKDEFNELYNKLKEEKNDMSVISYENNSVSLLDSAKTIRMYLNIHKLKDESTKHIILDDFLNKVFEDKIADLYAKNKGEYITQRQVQTLASWLVSK